MWGMARLATSIVYYSEVGTRVVKTTDRYGYATAYDTVKTDWETELLKAVDIPSIREAINTNDFDMALRNWEGIRQFLYDHTAGLMEGVGDGLVPLVRTSLPDFDYVVKKGIEFFWPEKHTLMRWLTTVNTHGSGWEAFLLNKVRPMRLAEEQTQANANDLLRAAADQVMRPRRRKAA